MTAIFLGLLSPLHHPVVGRDPVMLAIGLAAADEDDREGAADEDDREGDDDALDDLLPRVLGNSMFR